MARDLASGRLERSALHLLHRAGQCAAELFQSEVARSDLTPRQFAVLLTVAANEGLSQTSLVRHTGIDRSTLADIIRRMLKKGLIARRRTRDDARAYAVKLTEHGWDQLRNAEPVVRKVDEILLKALPERQRPKFIENLATIVDAIGSPIEDNTGEPKQNGSDGSR